jgi:hypothetical protein
MQTCSDINTYMIGHPLSPMEPSFRLPEPSLNPLLNVNCEIVSVEAHHYGHCYLLIKQSDSFCKLVDVKDVKTCVARLSFVRTLCESKKALLCTRHFSKHFLRRGGGRRCRRSSTLHRE